MKKIFFSLSLLPALALGQTFPVNNLQINGAVVNTTNAIPLVAMASQAANTIIANVSGFPASPAAFSVPSCSVSGSAINYVNGTGFTCSSGYAVLTGNTFTGDIVLSKSNPALTLNDSSGTNFSTLFFNKNSAVVWSINNTSSSGVWGLNRYVGGSFVDTPISASNSSGIITFADGITANGTNSIANASLTGVSTAATAPAGTNTTQIATTAFVSSHAPCPSILDNGGDNTGTNDNSSAFSTTAGLGPSGKACIYFPPGIYKFSSAITYTMPTNTASIAIIGAGQELTQLKFSGTDGIKINFITDANSAHVRDLSVLTGTTNTGTGIFLNQTAANTNFSTNTIPSDISYVTLRGADGFQVTDYWFAAVHVAGISNVNFISDTFVGASGILGFGIIFDGSASLVPVQFNVAESLFSGLSVGISYGNYVQGLQVTTTNFTNNGVCLQSGGSETALDQLTFTGNQCAFTSVGIRTFTFILQTMISNNLFLIPTSGNALYFDQSSSYVITGNTFAPQPSATSTTGITFAGYTNLSSVVTGNNFAQLTTGVNLTPSAKFVNVQANTYSGNTNTVINNCTTGCTVGVATQ